MDCIVCISQHGDPNPTVWLWWIFICLKVEGRAVHVLWSVGDTVQTCCVCVFSYNSAVVCMCVHVWVLAEQKVDGLWVFGGLHTWAASKLTTRNDQFDRQEKCSLCQNPKWFLLTNECKCHTERADIWITMTFSVCKCMKNIRGFFF